MSRTLRIRPPAMLISHIRRIDDPAVAKRWRAFWLVISVIALAPLVYLLASGSSWVRGVPVFASADWVVARITHADGNMRVLGLFCVFGLFAVTIALCGVTQQLRSLYGQGLCAAYALREMIDEQSELGRGSSTRST